MRKWITLAMIALTFIILSACNMNADPQGNQPATMPPATNAPTAAPTAVPTTTQTVPRPTATATPTVKASPTAAVPSPKATGPATTTTKSGSSGASRWPAEASAGVAAVWQPDLPAWKGRIWDADPLAGITVILDPGHGGSDPGAIQSGVYEKNLNYAVAQRLKEVLASRGATVILTRSSDTFVSLHRRAAFTGRKILERHQPVLSAAGLDTAIIPPLLKDMDDIITANSDVVSTKTRGIMYGYGACADLRSLLDIERQHTDVLFLSLHCNSAADASLHGSMVYYSTAQAIYSDELAESKPGMLRNPAYWYYRDGERQRLANLLYSTLSGDVPELVFSYKNPVRSDNYAVLREENLVGALVEMAYLSHSGDLALIRQAENQQRVAEAIARAVYRYYCE